MNTTMPPTSTQPRPNRTALWAGLAVLLLVLAAAGLYSWLKPTPAAAPQPTATAPTPAPAPVITHRHIYSETSDPKADIAAALAQAGRDHKRVLLDFGGDWCGDCQVLDIYFRQPPNDQLLQQNFIVVHVFIGHAGIDTHLDIAEKYGVAIHKGVPALAVLNPNGSVVFAQQTGEFENMRHMESDSVTQFLTQWKS